MGSYPIYPLKLCLTTFLQLLYPLRVKPAFQDVIELKEQVVIALEDSSAPLITPLPRKESNGDSEKDPTIEYQVLASEKCSFKTLKSGVWVINM